MLGSLHIWSVNLEPWWYVFESVVAGLSLSLQTLWGPCCVRWITWTVGTCERGLENDWHLFWQGQWVNIELCKEGNHGEYILTPCTGLPLFQTVRHKARPGPTLTPYLVMIDDLIPLPTAQHRFKHLSPRKNICALEAIFRRTMLTGTIAPWHPGTCTSSSFDSIFCSWPIHPILRLGGTS